jgi:hypothetical protein
VGGFSRRNVSGRLGIAAPMQGSIRHKDGIIGISGSVQKLITDETSGWMD